MSRIADKHLSNISWNLLGLFILTIRFVQGWIYWGGGSRRFIYAPQKIDPFSSEWMANKLQAAMPGAILGMGSVINFLLQHFYILYASIILLSLVEFFSGIALLVGSFTRLSGLITALLSILFMFTFGWQGSTCIDEWTMSICTLAMGITLFLTGSSVYSIDGLLLKHYPKLARNKWFLYTASGPLSYLTIERLALSFLIFIMLFTLGTYNYYRRSIVSHFYVAISPSMHHIAITNPILKKDGMVSFVAYVDSGTPATPAYIMRIALQNSAGKVVESWDNVKLSQLPDNSISNVYQYNRFLVGEYSLVGYVGAKAAITLTPPSHSLKLVDGKYKILVEEIAGIKEEAFVSLPPQ